MRGDRRLPITAPWIDPNQANPISFSAAVFFVPRERTSPRTKCHSRPNATRGTAVETGLRVLSSRTLFQTESRQSAEDVCKSRDVNRKLEGIEYGKPSTRPLIRDITSDFWKDAVQCRR